MRLKYQEQVEQLNCDFSDFTLKEINSFRWVFQDINDDRNFKPRYLLDNSKPHTACVGWALSFFTSKDLALKRLHKLTKNKENLFKKLGTHIANGILNEEDGLSDEPNSIGHFSFFEFENITLNEKFSIIEKVI